MSLSYQQADNILNTLLIDDKTIYICLHIDNPTITGLANIAQFDDSDIIKKEIIFNTPMNHPYDQQRRVLSNNQIIWNNTEIDAGQEITHFTLWSNQTDGELLFIKPLNNSKIVGSDGVIINEQAITIGIDVFIKP